VLVVATTGRRCLPFQHSITPFRQVAAGFFCIPYFYGAEVVTKR